MIITVDTDKIVKLTESSGEVVFENEAEGEMVAFLELKDRIDAAYDTIRERVEDEALKINPNFKSIQSDNLKTRYQEYGQKYGIDPSRIDEMDARYYQTEIKYKANSDEIDKEIESTGKTPIGVIINDRKKSLSISLKKGMV